MGWSKHQLYLPKFDYYRLSSHEWCSYALDGHERLLWAVVLGPYYLEVIFGSVGANTLSKDHSSCVVQNMADGKILCRVNRNPQTQAVPYAGVEHEENEQAAGRDTHPIWYIGI